MPSRSANAPQEGPARGRSRRRRNSAQAAAAFGVAVLDVATLQARPASIDGAGTIQSLLPEPAGDAYQHGRGLLAAGDVTGAIAAFRQALLQQPRSVDALNGLAIGYDRMGRYDLSRSYYDSALSIDPGSAVVANNLGYSLYLQGELHAAIPYLQRAAASGDAAAAAGGRRILNLVADRIRSDASEVQTASATAAPAVSFETADTPARIARATRQRAEHRVSQPVIISAPQARIEVASNGEQRLVLGAAAPDRELVATLGDAAALVIVTRAWSAADERAVAREATLADRVAARAAAADLAEIISADELAAALTATSSVLLAGSNNALGQRSRGDVTGAAVAAMRVAATHIAPIANDAPSAPTTSHRSKGDVRATAGKVEASELAPFWLLASRRDTRSADRRSFDGQALHRVDQASAFESDDRELNSFAARMRGDEAPDRGLSRAAAVARLEAMIYRMRPA